MMHVRDCILHDMAKEFIRTFCEVIDGNCKLLAAALMYSVDRRTAQRLFYEAGDGISHLAIFFKSEQAAAFKNYVN